LTKSEYARDTLHVSIIVTLDMKRVTILLGLSCTIFGSSIAQSQIKPDNTLGADRSQVNNDRIQGGAQRGSNLFHSFTDFSIGDGQRVDFVNPIGVNNIITRVTATPSNINGTLGVLGNANLFFLNPNGIFFGQNARLDLAGTFVGSTANGLKFNDGNVYSTVNPQVPLLTMTTPVGLQFGGRTGDINFTNSTSLLARDGTTNYAGNSILFAGGNITLTGSRLILPNGKIELAAINDVGSIAIDPINLTDTKSASLTVANGSVRGDITMQESSRLNTVGTRSGNVDLQGRNVIISGTSFSNRSIINTRSTGTDTNAKGGSVNINATGDVIISGDLSGISVSSLDAIEGGDVSISARNLSVLDGAYIETSPYDTGKGGQMWIFVGDTVKLATSNGEESDLISGAYGTATSGNINIQTGKLLVKDGAQIQTDPNVDPTTVNRNGKEGDINIIARESVEVSGVATDSFLSGFPKATGITTFSAGKTDSGNINIQTPRFIVKDGASISAGTDGSGAGGTISISGLNGQNAESVELVGNSNLGRFIGVGDNALFAGVGNGSRIRSIAGSDGNAGSVKIDADRVTLRQGTRIDVSTLGSGKSGEIDLRTKNLELFDGGQLISTTRSSGQAGKINIRADNSVKLDGSDPNFDNKRTFISLINLVSNQPTARKSLTDYLENPNYNSQQSLIAAWQQVNNNSTDRQILERYFTYLQNTPDARSNLQSFLNKTKNQSSLNDYNFFLNVGKNSAIISRSLSSASGNSGDISITTPYLNIQNNAAVTASGDGSGRGGNIGINANTIELDRGAITAKTASANGGEIAIDANKLISLRNQSEISASAAANGNGGNISLFTPNGLIIAVPIENSDITASAIGGSGGRIQIRADNVLGFSTQRIDSSSNIAATSTFGAQGIVTVTTLGTDPNKGLQAEPLVPNAPALSQACAGNNDGRTSQFIDSGKGGVTPSVGDALRSTSLWTDARAGSQVVTNPPTAPTIEVAQGWKPGTNRTVILTSQPHNYSEQNVRSSVPNCASTNR
jgi:filamentous hemagglutinin family protein